VDFHGPFRSGMLTLNTEQPIRVNMSINFAGAIKAEIAELEAELRADPRHAKLKHLRDLLALYEAPPAVRKVVTNGAEHATAEIPGTKEEKIKSELRRYMRENGGTVHRMSALQHLMNIGLMGHEKEPMRNLAAYMSHWKDDFVSDGDGNWSLRD
jgi:hypothetical protein